MGHLGNDQNLILELIQTIKEDPNIGLNELEPNRLYRVIFLTGPAQKSSKYGTGPPQQEKMTKYTGPTQDTEDDRVFNKQFLFIKINCSFCSFSCYRSLWIICQDG